MTDQTAQVLIRLCNIALVACFALLAVTTEDGSRTIFALFAGWYVRATIAEW